MSHNLVTFNFLRPNAQKNKEERHSKINLGGRDGVDGHSMFMDVQQGLHH